MILSNVFFFIKIYRGTSTVQARSILCANFVLDRMEYSAGRLYVAKFFDVKSRDAVIIILSIYTLNSIIFVIPPRQ